LDKVLDSSIHYYHVAFRSYDPNQQRLTNAYNEHSGDSVSLLPSLLQHLESRVFLFSWLIFLLQFQSQPQQQLVKLKLATHGRLLGWAAGLYHLYHGVELLLAAGLYHWVTWKSEELHILVRYQDCCYPLYKNPVEDKPGILRPPG
jgi:hypothetical protein